MEDLGSGGACVWLTGLSGAGKTTIAAAVCLALEQDGRHAELLDGDVVRRRRPVPLGFSRADRERNVREIGVLANDVVERGGVAVCAVVSPYRDARDAVRRLIGSARFLEVFVDTPLTTCEARDVKGLYARARRGEISRFTGVDDPYEPPLQPDLVLQTVGTTPEENARRIISALTGEESAGIGEPWTVRRAG